MGRTHLSNPRGRLLAIFLTAGIVVPCLVRPVHAGANFGRLSGTVTDTQGTPLMGATLLIAGPALNATLGVNSFAERVITDAHGRFSVEHLVPGLYSLRVTFPTRMPMLRNGVRVTAGQTVQQNFVLTEIFTSLRFQVPQRTVSTWGEDWKWVLRSSSATRPILRYQQVARSTPSAKHSKPQQLASQRFIGLTVGGGRRGEDQATDPGLGSVLAYLRYLSPDSDLLVAGSMTANGVEASSLATAFRKNLLNGDPQVLAVAVHQLSFSSGFPFIASDARGLLSRAQGVALSYSRARRLSGSLTLTTGFEVDYLNAARDAVMARPSMKLEYQANPSTTVAIRYGAFRSDGDGSLLDRIGTLNAFPRVTLRHFRPQLEYYNHASAALNHRLTKTSRVEVAAYRDFFRNPGVWGFGGTSVLAGLAGSFLPNPAAGGVILNAGNYGSTGLRASYSRTLGSYLETSFGYALGSALDIDPASTSNGDSNTTFSRFLRAERSQSLAGKVSARLPVSNTRIITSYEWLQRGRVTTVDPYGQAALQIQPFLGILIRQPLPTLAFLPAHIEALADFRNLLAQGYVPFSPSGEKPLLLTSAYRSFRGGFSVQF